MREKAEQAAVGMEPIPPELVLRAKGGDQAAFAELYERTSAMVYRTIRSMIQDEDQVWDIQQDSYLRAWRGISELQTPEAFLPWLRRIAVNTATTALNKRVPLTFTELAGDDEEDQEPVIPDLSIANQPELALDRKETARLVREILAELTQEQQAVVGLRYFENMPINDIAALLQVSPSTVKTQLARGKKRIELRVRDLEKQGVKLYGMGPIPFLVALLRRLEPAAGQEKKVLAAVLTKAPAAAEASAAGAALGTATGGTAAAVTAVTAKHAFFRSLTVRLLACALAAALIVGGKLLYDRLNRSTVPVVGPVQPSSDAQLLPDQSETAPVTPSGSGEADLRFSGSCGSSLRWSYDPETDTLAFDGSGAMYDYSQAEAPPWSAWGEVLKNVAIPDGMTYIGAYAFSNCAELNSVSLPEGVYSIGEYAFTKCTGLSSVTMPESLRSIQEGAFSYCSNLASAALPERLFSIGDKAFYYCDSLSSLTLPSRLTAIGDLVFCYCGSLTSVDLPEGLTKIGYAAFEHCDSLTSISIPQSLLSLGDRAFAGCSKLETVTVDPQNPAFSTDDFGVLFTKHKTTLILCPQTRSGAYEVPEGVTEIQGSAFSGCKALSSIALPDSIKSIGDGAFMFCEGLSSLELPAGLTSIGEYTFCGCSGLSFLSLPDGIASIDAFALSDCSNLRSVHLPEGLVSIGACAFFNCGKLASIALPASLTQIGDRAFSDCDQLNSISVAPENQVFFTDEKGILYQRDSGTLLVCPRGISGPLDIPTGVKVIAACAFDGCEELTAVRIPEGVTDIGEYAFSGCTRLAAVTIPDGVTDIGESAFSACALRTVVIPDSVSSLKSSSFDTDVSLIRGGSDPDNPASGSGAYGILFSSDRSVLLSCPTGFSGAYTVPEGVAAIGEKAFSFCEGLSSITIPESMIAIEKSAFCGCSSLKTVTIPRGVTSIGANAFSYCRKLTYVELPETLTALGEGAFGDCEKLRAVEIPEGVTVIESKTFEYCKALTDVTLPDSLRTIRSKAFQSCVSLSSLRIPEGVTYLGDQAFSGCTGLTDLTIPESVVIIKEDAFADCPALTIHGVPGSEAERFANENRIPFEAAPLGRSRKSRFAGNGFLRHRHRKPPPAPCFMCAQIFCNLFLFFLTFQ